MTTREYPGHGITVRWDSDLCIHSGRCARGLPQVFRPLEQPWVVATAAAAADVVATVSECPSGALTWFATDPGPGDRPDGPAAGTGTSPATVTEAPAVTVTVSENGPLEVIGPVTLLTADGTTMRSGEKFYLCRCGHSRTKPYCDGSHRREGFDDPGLGPSRH